MGSVLSIDVGGSRIKAAVLPEEIDLQSLAKTPRVVMRTLGWLNQHLPEIISEQNWASLVNQGDLSDNYGKIAICLPGGVEDGKFRREDLNVPVELREGFKQYTDRPVFLYNDAHAWSVGVVSYAELQGEEIPFPAVSLMFGTGVGFSLIHNPNEMELVDVSREGRSFPNLEQAAGRAIEQPWEAHQILGNEFFNWVGKEKKHWSYDRIRKEFSQRIVALIKDLLPSIIDEPGDLRSVIIGGGNSEFVSMRYLKKECGLEVKSLWGQKISVDPDYIPLLGLHRLTTSEG